ncbi:hypothetical protein ASD00_31620 [Ensifer sp. Root31]|nr:hypothetical protein ASD00_31620 [Ensifer sp. Root31]
MAAGSGAKDLQQLQRRRHPRPQGFHPFPAISTFRTAWRPTLEVVVSSDHRKRARDVGAHVSLAVPIEMSMRHGMPPILKVQEMGMEH